MPLIWRILEVGQAGYESPGWATVLEILGDADPDRVARVASEALTAEGYFDREIAERSLIDLGAKHPEVVMRRVGEVMLDRSRGMAFYFGRYPKLFEALPTHIIIDWLRQRVLKEHGKSLGTCPHRT